MPALGCLGNTSLPHGPVTYSDGMHPSSDRLASAAGGSALRAAGGSALRAAGGSALRAAGGSALRAAGGSALRAAGHRVPRAAWRQGLPTAGRPRRGHRRPARAAVLVAAALLATASAAACSASGAGGSGVTYYISPAGSDSAAGTSPTTAWRTLGRANSASLRPGDRVLLQGG